MEFDKTAINQSNSKKDDDESFALLSKVINGAVGSFLGVLTLFPLDTVKTRLQTQKYQIYNNWFHALGLIIRREGIKSLYQGFGITLALVMPELTVKLVTYDYMQHRLQSSNGDLTVAQKTFAAAVAGFAQIHVTTPSELIKVQLQTQNTQPKEQKSKKNYKIHTRHIFRSILRCEGVFGLYRGYVVTILRDVNFSMIYFQLYAFISDHGPTGSKDPDRPADWVAFVGGCISGLVAAVAVTPFDVVKTRMQSDKGAYDSILHCFKKIIRCNGAKELFAGASIRGLLLAPLFGICQMVYSYNVADKLKIILEESEEGTDI